MMSVATFQKNKRGVRNFGKLMKFSAWLQNLPNRLTPPPFRLLQISSAFWHSRALYVAARLDIASVLADETMSVEEIADSVSAQADPVYRLLRMLTAIGIFKQTEPGYFINNQLSQYLREDSPQNMRAMILVHNSDVMSRPWYEQLEQGVRTGNIPFKQTHAEELYDYMDTHKEFDALFSHAMDTVEVLSGDAFATDFDWSRFERIIDVGGSKGSKSVAILKRHPDLKALVVDRPQVISSAEDYWRGKEDAALLSRLSFQAGDVFGELPAASDKDIYLLCAVLHGFDDEQCIGALKNLTKPEAGQGVHIALMEMVMGEVNADVASTAFDMQMFMGTRGRERTLKEWQSIFDRSGIELKQVVGLRSFGKIIVLQGQ